MGRIVARVGGDIGRIGINVNPSACREAKVSDVDTDEEVLVGLLARVCASWIITCILIELSDSHIDL